jgi:hypothetical protein
MLHGGGAFETSPDLHVGPALAFVETVSGVTSPPPNENIQSMKKNTTPTNSPTPAKKTVAPFPAPKSTPAPAPAPKAKRAPAAKKPAAPVVAPAVKAVVVVPPVKPVAPKPVVTVITAKIDIGFGNALYLRGEGAGLSWDHGLLLDCVADDQWAVTLGESARPIVFKFLVNDLSWSTGEDYVVAPGSSVVFEPLF